MDVTADQVERWLLEVCADRADPKLSRCHVRGPFAVRENSRLFYAECTALPTPVAAKVCFDASTSMPAPGAAQREYDSLMRVAQAMGDDGEYSVSKPLLVRADVALLATEWIRGATMTDLVFFWRCGSARAGALVARAGRWLRRFHGCHRLPPGRLDVGQKLDYVGDMERDRAVSDPVFRFALRRLRECAEVAGSVDLRRSWVHGDFKADNLMVSGPRTLGIDITLRHENVIVYDLASFLNHLELSMLQPRGWRLLGSRRTLNRIFVDSYHDEADETIAVPLAWIRLYMLLGCWHDVCRSGSRLRSRVIGLTFRLMAHGLTQRMS